MKKRILALIVVLALVGALVPAIVFAADEDTVECTVTAVLVSVSVSDGDVAYGTLALGATKNTAVYDASDNPQTVVSRNHQVAIKEHGTARSRRTHSRSAQQVATKTGRP